MNLKLELSQKQKEAWIYLNDKETTELLYGGAAGGGKSYLGCAWIITSCMRYPGVRYLIGRARLTALKQSTLLTFLDILKDWGLKPDRDYKYNAQANIVKFANGSEVYLKDLFKYPTDPEFDSLGSTEFTGAFIDEASQVANKARQILSSRLRYKLKEYDLVPKLFIASNPAKNFLMIDFFLPWENKKLPKYRKFVPALVQDNPFIDPNYINQLKRMDKSSRERLLFGNWHYDNDPSSLVDYDAIMDLFTNDHVKMTGKMYSSSDLAMQGRDLFVVSVWNGLNCYFPVIKPKSTGKSIKTDLQEQLTKNKIGRSKSVVDSDGLGNYLESFMEGIFTYHGGSRAYNNVEFVNLRSQCGFKLAELINAREIKLHINDAEIKERVILELSQLKRDKIDKDESKKRIVPKDVMKEHLGHSPDFLDVLFMRMVFEFTTSHVDILEDPEGVIF